MAEVAKNMVLATLEDKLVDVHTHPKLVTLIIMALKVEVNQDREYLLRH